MKNKRKHDSTEIPQPIPQEGADVYIGAKYIGTVAIMTTKFGLLTPDELYKNISEKDALANGSLLKAVYSDKGE